jgi:hypothetical protein
VTVAPCLDRESTESDTLILWSFIATKRSRDVHSRMRGGAECGRGRRTGAQGEGGGLEHRILPMGIAEMAAMLLSRSAT